MNTGYPSSWSAIDGINAVSFSDGDPGSPYDEFLFSTDSSGDISSWAIEIDTAGCSGVWCFDSYWARFQFMPTFGINIRNFVRGLRCELRGFDSMVHADHGSRFNDRSPHLLFSYGDSSTSGYFDTSVSVSPGSAMDLTSVTD
jgi:hypothetical protein